MSENILEILCIGREILDGRVVDTNSTAIAQELSKKGLRPQYGQKVDDDPARMREAFEIAQSRAQIVIVCGGLGPTSDDRTLDVFAEFAGVLMTEYDTAVAHLKKYLGERNRPLTAPQMKQSLFPEGGATLANPYGTACGFTVKHKNTQWFFLPGPPRELVPMMENEVLGRLNAGQKFLSRAWITQFTAESELQEKLDSISKRIPQSWDLSFQTRFPEVAIGLHAPLENHRETFEKLSTEIRAALTGLYWFEGENSRVRLEDRVCEVLKKAGVQVGTVESCTGGLISERITDVSGSSAVFLGSWITYANEAKTKLGVAAQTIEKHGAVSEATAREMAECGLAELRSFRNSQDRTLCLSVTGVAGPEGGSPEKPVGLCYMALADSSVETVTERVQAPWKYDRSGNRRFFSQKALMMILKRLSNT